MRNHPLKVVAWHVRMQFQKILPKWGKLCINPKHSRKLTNFLQVSKKTDGKEVERGKKENNGEEK